MKLSHCSDLHTLLARRTALMHGSHVVFVADLVYQKWSSTRHAGNSNERRLGMTCFRRPPDWAEDWLLELLITVVEL